jgi:hypothetical protein
MDLSPNQTIRRIQVQVDRQGHLFIDGSDGTGLTGIVYHHLVDTSHEQAALVSAAEESRPLEDHSEVVIQ